MSDNSQACTVSSTELAAYDAAVQRGFFGVKPVRILIEERLAHPGAINDQDRRIWAFAILGTLNKLLYDLNRARQFIEAGLLESEDSDDRGIQIRRAYLLDQYGSLSAMSGNYETARQAFQDEVDLIQGMADDPSQPKPSVVSAYRGLASALKALGLTQEAQTALFAASQAAAQEPENPENQALVALQSFEWEAAQPGAPLPDEGALESMPTEQLVGRVLTLNIRAKAHLEHGDQAEGARLLRLAYREAVRLEFGGEVQTALSLSNQYGVTLN